MAGAEGRIHVIYHGVEMDRYRPTPGPGTGPLRILAVGSLVPRKGYPDFIELIARLVASGLAVEVGW